MSVVLYAEFTAYEGREAEVTSLLAGLTAQVRAEPGNILFEPAILADNPRRFFVYEAYRDEAAFESHLATAYGVDFNAAIADLIEGDGSTLTMLRTLR